MEFKESHLSICKIIIINIFTVYTLSSCQINEMNNGKHKEIGKQTTVVSSPLTTENYPIISKNIPTSQTITLTQINDNSTNMENVNPTSTSMNAEGFLLFSSESKVELINILEKSKSELITNEWNNMDPVPVGSGNIFYLSNQSSKNGTFDVYRKNFENENIERMTSNDRDDYGLSSCYDNNLIFYVRDYHLTDGSTRIYMLSSQKNEKEHEIYKADNWVYNIQCSPLGDKIAFLQSKDPFRKGDLYILDIVGKKIKQITFNTMTNNYSWSPEGKEILLTQKNEEKYRLIVFDVEHGKYSDIGESEVGYIIGQVLWSPNGKMVLYEEYTDKKQKLAILYPDANKVYPVLENTKYLKGHPELNLVWSPNSEYFAYFYNEDNKKVSVWIMQVENNNSEKIYEGEINSMSPVYWVKNIE